MVVVVVWGRHLARIEAYLTPIAINNAMAPGAAVKSNEQKIDQLRLIGGGGISG
jgi:hypothetical protein